MKMHKIIYTIGAVISLCLIVAFCVLAWINKIQLMWIILAVTAYLPICIILLGHVFHSHYNPQNDKENGSLCQKSDNNGQEDVSLDETHKGTISPETDGVTKEAGQNDINIAEEWTKAMYQRFAPAWENFFDESTHPLNKANKAELSLLLWNIASLTMDYLIVLNQDPNKLARNEEMVNAIINGKDVPNDIKLETFYDDPTTVQEKAVVVYDYLNSQLAAKQSFETVVFGYLVKLGKK